MAPVRLPPAITKQMDANVSNFNKLITDLDYFSEIPDYQRDFSWSKSNVELFLSDIRKSMVNNQTQYFIGSFLLHEVEYKIGGRNRYPSFKIMKEGWRKAWVNNEIIHLGKTVPEGTGSAAKKRDILIHEKKKKHAFKLVDGQQRFTTLFILAQSINRRIESCGGTRDDELHRFVFHEVDNEGAEEECRELTGVAGPQKRLMIRHKGSEKDDPLFKEIILNGKTEEKGNNNLIKAPKWINDWLDQTMSEEVQTHEDASYQVSELDGIDDDVQINDSESNEVEFSDLNGDEFVIYSEDDNSGTRTMPTEKSEFLNELRAFSGDSILDIGVTQPRDETDVISDQCIWYQNFAKYLMKCTTFIKVSVSTENVVYDIFVTLNATGEALTEGEKFRSFCLGRAYRTGATGAVKPLLDTLWKSIQQHGGDDPHSIFLHHYVRSKGWSLPNSTSQPGKSSTFNIIRDKISEDDSREIKSWVKEIKEYSELFRFSKYGLGKFDDKFQQDIVDLNWADQHFPLVMAVAALQNEDKFEKFLEALKNIFIFAVILGDVSIYRLSTPLWDAIRKLTNDADFNATIKILDDYRNKAIKVSKDKEGVKRESTWAKRKLKAGKFESKSGGNVRAKLLLRTIEGLGEYPGAYNKKAVQLEHIIPSAFDARKTTHATRRGQWEADCADYYEHCHKIGNCILLERDIHKNVELKTWRHKKPTRKQGPLNITPGTPPDEEEDAWKSEYSEFGKYHYYRSYRGGSKLASFKYLKDNFNEQKKWTGIQIKERTQYLADKMWNIIKQDGMS